MDLLKDEQKLIDKKHKARDNLERKRKYFMAAQERFRKTRREFKVAAIILQKFRKEHKFELADLRADPVDVPVDLYSSGPSRVIADKIPPVEENTD